MRNKHPSVLELCGYLERGECSSEDLAREYLLKIEETEPSIGAFLTVCREEAIREARESDARRRAGKTRSRFDGIPYAAKDSFCTKGIRTTAASRMLRHYIPPYDATVISLLRNAGGVLLGKTNLDEFAMGSDGSHSALGITRNPLDPTRVAGGSSGGSAAAVASGEAPFALGSDTGGSTRQPAAFCATVGLKPTYGTISRYGMIAFASSLDCVGILSQSVADAAEILGILAKKDPRDATSVGLSEAYPIGDPSVGVRGLRVGVVADGGAENSPFVLAAVRTAANALEGAGACVEEVILPSPEQALMAYCIISAVEASSNLARYDGFRYGSTVEGSTPDERSSATRGAGFGEEVKSRILLGNALLTGDLRERYYLPACRMREQIRRSLSALLGQYDLILQPTAPCGAHLADEKISPLQMRQMDLCTVYANLAGLPAISVPAGTDENGMPLGVQLTAAPHREDLILRAAYLLDGMNL